MESIVRATVRPEELKTIVANVGIPQGRSAVFTSNTGPHSATVQVYLTTADKRARNDREIGNAIRPKFTRQFPGTRYQFVSGGLVSRVINFGSETAIAVEILGYDLATAEALSREVARIMQATEGVADVTVGRDANYPQFEVKVDREKAASVGLSQRDIAQAAGFSIRLGGQTEQQREAFGSLAFTSLLAVILVYMVLASQFKSLKDPFTIMFSVPMGLIGVFWALYLTDTTLSSTSFMGIIMMVGIVVSNGVLLVEYINELRRHGMPVAEAVPRAGRVRLRPILMTVFATVVGLLPMAFAFGVGTEANQPLAIAVIGGRGCPRCGSG